MRLFHPLLRHTPIVPILALTAVIASVHAASPHAARAASPAPTTRTVALLGDREIQSRMDQLHRHIWDHFVHPRTNLIYDYIAPPGSPNPWGHLPTPAEIKGRTPNPCGWGAGMEDCAINGGAYLASLVERHALTGRPEQAAEARRIYQGLRLLGTVAPRKGFVARGVLPDGKSFYPNSSVDQYTLYVYGLWTYYHSAIATAEEKAQIREIMHNICARIEDDGFDILQADGKPAQVCDVGVIRSDRSSRLLEIYRVGADLTGETHWLEIYKEKLAENNYARLRDITTPSRVDILPWKSRQMVYGILQNQVSLIPLLALETSLPIKATYLEALRLDARIVEDRLFQFREYKPTMHTDNYTLGAWRTGGEAKPRNLQQEFNVVRNPTEAMMVMLMARENYLSEPYPPTESDRQDAAFLRDACRELLSTYDFPKMRTHNCLYAEIVYWLAVKQHLLQYTPE